MTNFLSRIIDLLLPPRCICCGKIVSGADGLCAECFNEVSFITKPYCAKCGHPFDEVPDGMTVDTRYAAAFTSPAPSLIAAIAQASAMASVSAQLTP